MGNPRGHAPSCCGSLQDRHGKPLGGSRIFLVFLLKKRVVLHVFFFFFFFNMFVYMVVNMFIWVWWFEGFKFFFAGLAMMLHGFQLL